MHPQAYEEYLHNLHNVHVLHEKVASIHELLSDVSNRAAMATQVLHPLAVPNEGFVATNIPPPQDPLLITCPAAASLLPSAAKSAATTPQPGAPTDLPSNNSAGVAASDQADHSQS